MIAAEKNSAYYVFGVEEKGYYYLDPHITNLNSM